MERSRPAWLALALAVLAGGLVWLALAGRGGAGRAARALDRDASRARPAPARELDPLAEQTAGGDVAARGALASSAPPTFAPAAERAFAEPPADGLRLRVLRGHPGVAVPMAEVAFARGEPHTALVRLEQSAGYLAWDRQLAEPTWYRADAEGRLRVPRTAGSVAFCADAGDFGVLRVYPDGAREQELRLLPDHALSVRVTDPSGEPAAGAWVGIRYSLDPGYGEILDRGRTDDDGLIRFEHLREYTHWYWPHMEELAVVLLGVWREPPAFAFDPEAPPERVDLVLPPSSSLAVEVVEADGTPARDPVLVLAGVDGEDLSDSPVRSAREVAREGRALIEQIEPGLDLVVVARRALDGESEPARVRSAPAGSTARLFVPLGERTPILVARLLSDGAPAAELAVGVTIRAAGGGWNVVAVRTDVEGRIRGDLGDVARSSEPLELSIVADVEPERSARVSLLGPLAPGELDLGDVALEPTPSVVSGRVVDAAGAPVRDARVSVTAPDRHGRIGIDGATSDADGKFDARGRTDRPVVRVRAYHPDFTAAQDAIEVAPGTSGLELVLGGPAGRVRGSAIFDAAWLADFAEVRWRPEGAAEWSGTTDMMRPGAFEVTGVAPGRCDVGIGIVDEPRTPIVVRGVLVRAGETTEDPRLAGVDLRGVARLLTLRVVGADGEPVEDGSIWTRPAGETEWSSTTWIDAGRAHVITLHPELDVYVAAPGHRSAYVPGVRAEREIQLGGAIRARFHHAAAPPPDDRAVKLGVKLIVQEPGMPEIEVEIDPAREPGAGEIVHLPSSEGVRVVWSPMLRQRYGWSMRRDDEVRAPIDVRDQQDVQDVPLTVPPAIAEAIEAAPPAAEDE